MGLITETVWTKIASNTKKYYHDLGYEIPEKTDKYGNIFTPKGTKIEVKINDLMNNSNAQVNYRCDRCDKKCETTFGRYNKCVRDNKILCKQCSLETYVKDNRKKTILKNSTSFYQWCINNNKEEIIERWDYEKNGCSPSDVTFRSSGINGTGYWFKCLDNSLHKSELKNINEFTSGRRTIKCNQCNSLAQYILNTYGDDGIKKYWSNENTINPWSIARHSTKKVYFICQNCRNNINTTPDAFCQQRLSCPACSDGISYPEKFIHNLIIQLKNKNKLKDFDIQKKFDWAKYNDSNNQKLNGVKIYDFYIKEYDIIIETHGMQHYDGSFVKSIKAKTCEEEHQNDIIKEDLAKAYIKNYINLDCRYSNLEHIKKEVMLSKLPTLLKFSEKDIDWFECHKNSLNSYKKFVCNIWNNGNHSVKDIKQITKLGKTTIRRYLKEGTICGWCKYDADEIKREQYIKNKDIAKNRFQKSIICISTNLIYKSMKKAHIHTNVSHTSISNCCIKKGKYAGKLPDGTKLRWQYLDEYMQQNGYTDPKDIPGVTIYEENNT